MNDRMPVRTPGQSFVCAAALIAGLLVGLIDCRVVSAQEPVPGPPPGEPFVYVHPIPVGPPLPPPDPTFSFTFSGGWSRLETDGDSLVDGEDGYYFDFDFAGRPKTNSPLWLGVGFGGSYFEQSEETEVNGGAIPTFVEVDAALSLFTIEPRLTYVLLPRKDRGLYLAGRIGAGLLIADYWVTQVVQRPLGFFVDGDEDTVAAFEVRPAAQIGYCGGNWVVGAEVSQMWAWGDFGDALGDQITELRAGFFFTLRY